MRREVLGTCNNLHHFEENEEGAVPAYTENENKVTFVDKNKRVIEYLRKEQCSELRS